MGAWGTGSFENDTALDFVHEYKDEGIDVAIAAFERVIDEDEDEVLDSDYCSEAIAGAEIVAALIGKPAAQLPSEVRRAAEIDETPEAPVVELAKKAITRVRTGSELKDLWEESEDAALWLAAVDDLLARLS